MILRLSVDNFKSFESKTEISFISSSKIRGNSDHKEKIKQTSLLKYAVVYGANASGKSNLVDAFSLIRSSVQSGIPVEASNDFCRNTENNKEIPSSFEIQFTIDNKFYVYGFRVILNKRKVVEEWLYELFQNGELKVLFERDGEKAPTLGARVSASEVERNRFNVYAEDFAGHDTSLFITEMNRNKNYSSKSKLIFFKKVFDWITHNMIILNPNTAISNSAQYYDEKSLKKINQLIKTFDTGITSIAVRKISLEEMGHMVPEPIMTQLLSDLKTNLKNVPANQVRESFRTATNFFNIQINDDGEMDISTLCLKHGTSVFDFEFKDESDGTRRIFDLIDMLMTKRDDIIYIVDELERSLHPKLTEHFLKLFMEAHKGQHVQLLFTTHEDSIMDQELFRRDEIWFVERSVDNTSRIYSLDRFKERYDKKLSKEYLAGRYGAIPVLKKYSF